MPQSCVPTSIAGRVRRTLRNTGCIARPERCAWVSFVTRNGEPKVVHVLRSSGSSILDEAAVAIVASGHYPAMPSRVFAGEMEHAFAVTIEFRAPS